MRTTLRIEDHLLAAAKQRAAERGTTLTAIVEEALRMALSPPKDAKAQRRPIVTFGGDGFQPGVDLDDSASLLDLMEGR